VTLFALLDLFFPPQGTDRLTLPSSIFQLGEAVAPVLALMGLKNLLLCFFFTSAGVLVSLRPPFRTLFWSLVLISSWGPVASLSPHCPMRSLIPSTLVFLVLKPFSHCWTRLPLYACTLVRWCPCAGPLHQRVSAFGYISILFPLLLISYLFTRAFSTFL